MKGKKYLKFPKRNIVQRKDNQGNQQRLLCSLILGMKSEILLQSAVEGV